MEIQEKNGFSIVGFIAQVLIILIFVFVLMWLFPTKSYLESNGTVGAGTGSNSALSEMLFNQNLLSMKDAAREYFTVKRMPSTNGGSKTIKLDDMIKSSMVVELVDANGKKCDRNASYVKVTKVDNEYELEVSLTCGKVTKTIKTTIGCYNYCESGMCEKEETQVTLYQYSKKTNATSKWSDWSEWSKTAVTESKTKKVETKVVNEKTGTKTNVVAATASTTYNCPDGYTLSADKKNCSKATSTTDVIAATSKTTYSCSTGYTLSSDNKTCTKTDKVASTAKTTYSCAKGTLSGTKCVVTETKSAIPHVKVSFSCTNGVCQSESVTDYYYCSDSSYVVSGKTCKKTTKTNATSKTTYSCSTGYTLSSDKKSCTKVDTKSSTAKTTYSCPTGYTLNDNKCSKTTVGTAQVASTGNTKYACATGTLNSQNKCDVTVDVYSNVTYYRYKTYTTTAAKTVYKWSSSSNDQKLIKAGYKYTGVTKTSTSK